MLSSNLVKHIFTYGSTEEKRVIDTNDLVEKRLSELEERTREKKAGGFVSGLNAQIVEPVSAGEGEEADQGGENIIKASELSAAQLLEEAKEEAERMIAEAQAEAMRMKNTAFSEIEIEKTRILAEAQRQGYEEGMKNAESRAVEAERTYEQKSIALEELYNSRLQEMEPSLVDTITDIYQHIFHVELDSYRDVLTFLISTTLRKTEGGHNFVIHVSTEDYPYVNMQKKQFLAGILSAGNNAEVVEDMTLSRNECLIETENGVFDCGLGTQLAELKKRLMLLAWSGEE